MRSKAQLGALVFGVAFLLVGVAGFLVPGGAGMDADLETAGRLLGLFPMNLLHNVVHLAFGVWGLLASRSHDAARNYGRIGSVAYGALVVLAFLSPTLFGLVPIGSHNIWLHAVLAIGLAWVGFLAGDPARTPAADTRPVV
jgi:hypothetical protein